MNNFSRGTNFIQFFEWRVLKEHLEHNVGMDNALEGFKDLSARSVNDYLVEENEGEIKEVLSIGRYLIIALSHKLIQYHLDKFIVVNQINSVHEIKSIVYASKLEKVNGR